MKKAFIIPMLAIAAFGLVACNNGQPSSSESSTSTKAPFVAETVTIDNKDGLKALWRVGFDNRAVDITVKDASGNPGNPSALVTSGEMTVTSSNTAAVKALGLSLIPVAPGKSTITVAINGKTDTVEVEVKEKRAEAGVDAILQEFANLAKGSYTEESVPCVGVVSRYETFYNAKDKNVTVWIKDAEGTKEIELYKVPGAKGVDLSDLIPGDTVHVEGKIQNYNGTFEYTAAGSITKVDKIARPTPATRPEPTETTIDAIIEKQAKEMGVEYKIEGIWENGKGDDYGNGYLTNPETGKSIQVYGSTATETAIEFNGLTGSPLYVFTNPKDAKTTLKDLKNGMKVTANALNITYVSSDGKKITPEVALVVKKTEAVETKYAASAETVENGTVELSKTADLAYGEEVTVTATPAAGYKLTKLVVDHGYGKEDITETKKFKATVANKVIATFDVAVPVESKAKYTFTYDIADRSVDLTTPEAVKEVFTKASGDDIVSTFSDLTKVAAGANGGSGDNVWAADNLLKLGSSKAAGSMKITLSTPVKQMVITGWGWKNTVVVKANTLEDTNFASKLANKANVEAGDFAKSTFIFEQPVEEITLATVNTSIIIETMEFFVAAAE